MCLLPVVCAYLCDSVVFSCTLSGAKYLCRTVRRLSVCRVRVHMCVLCTRVLLVVCGECLFHSCVHVPELC